MVRQLSLTLLVALLIFGETLSSAAPAGAAEAWQSGLTEFDRTRLQNYAHWRRTGLQQALSPDPATEDAQNVLRSLTDARTLPIIRNSLAGRYRCRTIKVGGSLALTIYGWFTCVISVDGARLVFRKVNGSQRTTGRLYRRDQTSMVYVGAAHYGYDKPRQYRRVEPGAPLNCNKYRNEVAVLNRIGANRYTLNFPRPLCESKFNILELERVR